MIAAEYVSKTNEHKNVILSFSRLKIKKEPGRKVLRSGYRIYKPKIVFPAKALYTIIERIQPHKERTHSRNVYVAVLHKGRALNSVYGSPHKTVNTSLIQSKMILVVKINICFFFIIGMELIIDEYRTNERLWNPIHNDYKNKLKKLDPWNKIGNELKLYIRLVWVPCSQLQLNLHMMTCLAELVGQTKCSNQHHGNKCVHKSEFIKNKPPKLPHTCGVVRLRGILAT